jgi:hypothetical protein
MSTKEQQQLGKTLWDIGKKIKFVEGRSPIIFVAK